MVTAELAVGLPSLLLVLLMAIGLLGAVGATLRCEQAAREGATAVSGGASNVQVRWIVAQQTPRQATTAITSAGDDALRVTVQAPVWLPGPWQPLAGWHVGGSAVGLLATGRSSVRGAAG